MKPRISLRQSLQDPNLLGGALTGESWAAWRTLLVASMGESLTEDEREIFSKLTGREHEPLQRVDQFADVIGRRGGKSRAMATLACYLAGLCDHTDALVPGERGVYVTVGLAVTKKSSTEIHDEIALNIRRFRFRPIWATATSSTQCATPSWRRPASRTSGTIEPSAHPRRPALA